MLTILTLLITSFNSFACLIDGPKTIYSYDNIEADINFIKCSDAQKEKFNNVLQTSEGKLTTRSYNRISGDDSIKLSDTIIVKSLDSFIRSHVKVPKNIKLDINTAQIIPNFTSLSNKEKLIVECESCHLEGNSNIKLTKTDDIRHKVLWINAKTLFKTEVLVANNNLPYSFDSIKDSHFKKEFRYISSPTQVYTDLKSLKYKKLTRNISKGHVLRYQDIIKKELVRYGKPVKVIVSNSTLKMTTKATPLENGYLGDQIKLKNLTTKKIIVGEVIDKNEVKVKL